MKTHLVCLELEALSFVVKIYYKDGVSGELKSILLFHCHASHVEIQKLPVGLLPTLSVFTQYAFR